MTNRLNVARAQEPLGNARALRFCGSEKLNHWGEVGTILAGHVGAQAVGLWVGLRFLAERSSAAGFLLTDKGQPHNIDSISLALGISRATVLEGLGPLIDRGIVEGARMAAPLRGLSEFLSQCVVTGQEMWVRSQEFRQRYNAWCNSSGCPIVGRSELTEMMRQAGFCFSRSRRDSNGVQFRSYEGLTLCDDVESSSRDSRHFVTNASPRSTGVNHIASISDELVTL